MQKSRAAGQPYQVFGERIERERLVTQRAETLDIASEHARLFERRHDAAEGDAAHPRFERDVTQARLDIAEGGDVLERTLIHESARMLPASSRRVAMCAG